MSAEARLKQLGIELPDVMPPAGSYLPAKRSGDLMEVFGDAGRHARSAVGMAELPFDIAVEIELVAEVVRPGP